MELVPPVGLRKYTNRLSPNGFQRIYHNHIRKCAGTSINKALIKSLGGDNDAYEVLANKTFHKMNLKYGSVVGWNASAINRGSFFFGFSHEPLHNLELDENTFVFSLLRDPVKRAVSHFNMLKDIINEGGKHPALIVEKNFAFGDFTHFLENIPKAHLCAQLYNFSKTYDLKEAIDTLRRSVNYIGDIHSSEKKLIPYLSKEFNLNINYSHLRKSKSSINLSKKQHDRLKDLLSEEIHFYKKAQPLFGVNQERKSGT